MKIPTYHDVIAEARSCYRDNNSPSGLQQAEQLLRQGLEDFPYALPIGDELVLVLEKQDRDEDALKLLAELTRRFRDSGEETYSRFGKIFKKRADRLVSSGHAAAAISAFNEAEKYYGLAFEKSGAFYARVNQLTTRFLNAAVQHQLDRESEAADLVRKVRLDAEQMLKDPQIWKPRLSDDHIWLPATRGEVYLLLADWEKAAEAYREAVSVAAGQHFYHQCMQSQVEMLMKAHETLGESPTGPIADPATFFSQTTDENKANG